MRRGSGWEQVQTWSETLSGGERQRLALARVLFHKPAYAILGEQPTAAPTSNARRMPEEPRAVVCRQCQHMR